MITTSRWVGILAVLALLLPAARASEIVASPLATEAAAVVPLVGQIDDYSRDDLLRRFERARAAGAKIILIEIDSPGGLVTSSMEISRFLKRQSDVHTIAFVKDKAYSGAAMVAVACNEIVMGPEAVIGDCAPIIFDRGGQLQPLPEVERAKEESPVVDEFLDSARHNGYDPLLLRAMVSLRDPVRVFHNSSGQLRVIDQVQEQSLTSAGQWSAAPGYENVGGPHALVTLRSDQAVALGLAKAMASNVHALAAERGYTIVADLTPGTGEKIIELLNSPFLRFILLTIFLQSLYISLHAPGHGAAEAVAVTALGVLVGVPLLTGYAQWWEIAFIFIGLALCAFEIFVFPGHMVSLIVGTLMVLIGLVSTFVGKEPTGTPGWLPSLQQTWTGLQTGLSVVVASMASTVLLSLWLRRFLPAIPYFNKLILNATTGDTEALKTIPRPQKENWPFLGTKGRAATDLRPGGLAEFPYADSTRKASVVSASGYVPAGEELIVEEASGHRVVVRALRDATPKV